MADYFCLPSGSGWALGAQSYRKDLHWKVLLVFLLCHSIAFVPLGLAENLILEFFSIRLRSSSPMNLNSTFFTKEPVSVLNPHWF